MKQTIFTNKNFFKINIDDYASQKEIKVIVESFKECVDIFYTTFNALRKDTKNKTSEFETIFGNAESKTMLVVLNSLYKIKSLLDSEIKFMRGSFFFDRKHQKHADVLASANLDKKYVSIYNPFFEKDFRKEDNRGGVIFHELAHLVGLKDESELNNIKSAECLKNFALLVSGRVSVEDVVDNNNEDIEKSKDSDEELTYSPDQPRAPKGQPNGGQWIDKNGSNSGESSQSKKERGAQNNQEPLSEEETEFDFLSYSKEEEEKAMHNTVLNLQDGGIKFDETGGWCAANIGFKNLIPNKPYTVRMRIKYNHTAQQDTIIQEKTEVNVVMDIIADKNGNATIERAGIFGEYKEKQSEVKINSKLDIVVEIFLVEGEVKTNYSNVIPVEFKEEKDQDVNNKNKFGLGYYAVAHASKDFQVEYKKNPKKDYCGGAIPQDMPEPENIKLISIAKIKYDNGKQTTENCLNTAKGKGGKF